jgi:hypothetical protein
VAFAVANGVVTLALAGGPEERRGRKASALSLAGSGELSFFLGTSVGIKNEIMS